MKGVMQALEAVDTSGKGFISVDQLKLIFDGIQSGMSKDDRQKLLDLVPVTPDGQVHYPSFVEWLWGKKTDIVDRVLYGQAPLMLPQQMKGLSMEEIHEDRITRKCKIICTMGPSCWSEENLIKLFEAGCNICRLNFSHGDHEGHGACVTRIRAAAAKWGKKPIAILLDTKGPEIRTGFFKDGTDKIELTAGQDLKLVTDYSFKGDNTCFAVTYEKMPSAVSPGQQILIADGSLVLKVESCDVAKGEVMTKVLNSCKIGERKNCNLPGVKVDLPVLQEKDIKDLKEFGVPQGVDFVAASFVQNAADCKFIRETLGEAGKNIKIIPKIENQEGLINFDEIVDNSDGIMIARGDLGMEIPPEKVFMAQKVMTAKCNLAGKPVITATQMLESMCNAPRPTRAEAGDVANAVLDGTDAVMLSGETAGGKFPIEAVTIMRRIVEEAEGALDYNAVYVKRRLDVLSSTKVMSEAEATCSSAVKTAYDVKASCIFVITKTGAAARLVAKYRPEATVFMGSTNEQALRQAGMVRGIVTVVNSTNKTVDERIKEILESAMKLGCASAGDPIVVVYGKDGNSNLIKIITVPGDEKPLAAPTGVTTYSQFALALPRNMGQISMEEKTVDSFCRKCKIVCTMGPSCWSVENLVKLIDAGMNVARLNFSHGDHEGHGSCVQRIREADDLRPDKPTGILLDTKGPEIRTGFFNPDTVPKGKIDLEAGKPLKLVTDYSFKGDATCFAVTYKEIVTSVKPGNIILCADGSLSLKVTEVGADFVMTEVGNDCSLGERKNCNLPGVKVDLPVLQDKDKDDLVNFGIPKGVHFCAASFVQSAADVKLIRDVLGEKGKDIKIIPKIENQEGLINFDEICEAADGIMIARGDLGMEIPPEKVFLAQKVMTAKCNLFGKPCITATQMLESMCNAPRPTRAEAGDVANAVLDGTDCVMLSGETAGGAFPIEAVTIMRRIVEEAERAVDYQSMYMAIRTNVLAKQWRMSSTEAYASSAVKTSADCGAPLIVCLTETGSTARILSKYRPSAAILAITSSEYVARYLLSSRGVISMITPLDGKTSDELATAGMAFAKKMGVDGVVSGAKCVLVTEEREGQGGAGVSAKIVKIVNIP